MEIVHMQALQSLCDYSTSHYLNLKFLGLIRLLLLLSHVESATIESLFFRETIGQIPIGHLLNNMYKCNPKLYPN